ncbi:MAG: flagellar protein FlbB [Pseudolabrys sp.]|nr:flagellar protein FlbB [Pseudolabrys sp.]
MIRLARDFRLIPIVLLATVCLFALKVSGIVFDGGYTLAERLENRGKTGMKITTADSVPDYPKIVVAGQNKVPAPPAENVPWAQAMFNFNSDAKGDVTGSVDNKIAAASGDITGSTGGGEKKADAADAATAAAAAASAAAAGPPLKSSEKAPAPPKLEVAGDLYPLVPGKINSPGERAILGRLQDRRQTLEERARELEMRESLIKAAEKRLEAKVAELKDLEARIKVTTAARDKTEAQRFNGIVAMYENMKPKDAARIFDRLEMRILVEVATAMKTRAMSQILAQMSSEAAEKLTVELANRASAQAPQSADRLPKIEGRPGNS